MNKLLVTGAASLILVLGSPRADAGHMYLEGRDCNPTYRLWEVSWNGPWNILGGKHLDQGSSNVGPWKRVLSFVPDSSCYFPALNQRWYRIAKPKLPIGFQTLASIWVPRSRCSGAWLR
jgi:hypothetical protein